MIGADIIDLKTERFDSSQLHDHINRHRPQLQAYRTAAATFLKLPEDRISTRLVFIESGQIVNLHAIEGSIDFSPKKKSTVKKVASKASVHVQSQSDKTEEKKTETKKTESVSESIVPSTTPPPPKAKPKRTKPEQKTLWD